MPSKIKNKFLRFLIGESSRRRHLIVVLVLMVGVVLEFNFYGAQKPKLTQALKDKKIVERIGQMEQNIQSRTLIIPTKNSNVPDLELVLQGISIVDGEFRVLINGDVYRLKDKIGDYVVEKITTNTLTLRQPLSGGKKFFTFSEATVSAPEQSWEKK